MRVAPRCSCVARLRRCAHRIIQCFGRSVVFGTPVVVQQAVFCAMACVCLVLWRYPFEFGVTRGSGCRAVFCLHTVSFVAWCTCFATWLRSRPNIAGLERRPRWWNSGADVLHKPRDVNGCFLALCVRGAGVWLSIVHGVQWCSHSHLLWCAYCYFTLFRADRPCVFHSLPGGPSSRWPNQRADSLHPFSSCANVCDGFVRGGVIL